MKTLYIAGPMRGRPDFNIPAFTDAAARFRAAGWTVQNPPEINGASSPMVAAGLTPEQCLRNDVQALAGCQAIAVLPGWEASVGARCEVVVAMTLGLPFYDAVTLERIPTPERVVVTGGYEQAPGVVPSLDALGREIAAWQHGVFPHATPASAAEHLRREAVELAANPTDPEEMADVFHLLVSVSDTAGVDLTGAVARKFAVNRARTWGEPDADGVVEHVRDEERAQEARHGAD